MYGPGLFPQVSYTTTELIRFGVPVIAGAGCIFRKMLNRCCKLVHWLPRLILPCGVVTGSNNSVDKMEVIPGVYQIKMTASNLYLIVKSGELTLIDGGTKAGSPRVLSLIERLGFPPVGIKTIVADPC